MRRLTALAATGFICAAAPAQYWSALGRGTIGVNEVQTLFGDSVSDRLLAGGTFLHIMNDEDTVQGFGQAAWNGSRWDSLATRIQGYGGSESAQQTNWFLRYEESLYACGAFTNLPNDGAYNRGLARLNEQTSEWEDLGCLNPSNGGMLTLVPKIQDTTLYATGFYGSVCGYPESCVFRYDGSAFHIWEPFQQIPYASSNYVGFIFSYKGYTYMTGSYRDPLSDGYVNLMRWNGASWEYVPGWNTSAGAIKELLLHNDTLYLGGTFKVASGGPGNLVASFDGEHWNDLGGGLEYSLIQQNAAVLGLQWYRGKLVACGFFDRAGNAPCTSIAKWDGERWCGFPGDIRWQNNALPVLYEMAVWRDSLYVCGGINTVDGDTMRQVIQWLGGDADGDCSSLDISESDPPSNGLVLVPTGEEGRWTAHLPGPGAWQLSAYNMAGQQVGHWQAQGASKDIDLSEKGQGLFLLRATNANKEHFVSKMINP
jgi:hypothetical protein